MAEGLRPGSAAPFAEPFPSPAARDEDTAGRLGKVNWQQPPADTLTAAEAYRRHAGGGAGVYARAWLIAGGIAALPLILGIGLALLGEIIWPLGCFAAAIFLFWTLFPLLVRGPKDSRASELGKLAFADGVARAESLDAEDPNGPHDRWPEFPFPGPVRRLWRGTTADGRTFRLMLLNDPSGGPGRSGFEGVLIEDPGGEAPVPEGVEVEAIRHDGMLALIRPTPLGTGPTLAGLQQLRASVERR